VNFLLWRILVADKDKDKSASSLTMTKWQAVPTQAKALDMLLLSKLK
jgi:hypothetical protein